MQYGTNVAQQLPIHFTMSAIRHPVFIADVHLGKLAKLLRLLGFNTLYSNAFTNEELVAMAKEENRILLSKSNAYSKLSELEFLRINSSDVDEQLTQVVKHFYLQEMLRPFTRCLICNGELATVPKELVEAELLPETRKFFHEFFKCAHCSRIYWKGSHYERMLELLEKIQDWS